MGAPASEEGSPPGMGIVIGRVEAKSLKAACVEKLERLIIAGKLPIGSALPPERELAPSLGVSRPVVHEAIVELASKGFLRVEPRRGAFVNDFYRHGTLAILESLVLHDGGELSPEALEDVLGFRLLIEAEAARLAASRGGSGFLEKLDALVEAEAASVGTGLDAICELDFEFHLIVAEASGSLVFPLLVNSFKPLYLSLSARFYSAIGDGRDRVKAFHRETAAAIADRDADRAAAAMRAMLEEGARILGAGLREASGLSEPG